MASFDRAQFRNELLNILRAEFPIRNTLSGGVYTLSQPAAQVLFVTVNGMPSSFVLDSDRTIRLLSNPPSDALVHCLYILG